VLHSFGRGNDGSTPYAALIFDAAGNLYGTTDGGGARGSYGTVFELTHKAGGGWTEKVLHNFIAIRGDGAYPTGGLIFDASGNLYGTTGGGGTSDDGTVFELTPGAGGVWAETVLYNFNVDGEDGNGPTGSLILDATGNLYGTTGAGGATGTGCGGNGCGTAFELTPTAGGGWTEKILHSFNDDGADGYFPSADLIFDPAGNLYGPTVYGGTGTCQFAHDVGCGVVFELTPEAGGNWTENVIRSFNGKNGYRPLGGLIPDATGNLYGTTDWGGSSGTGCEGYGCGVVFEITP